MIMLCNCFNRNGYINININKTIFCNFKRYYYYILFIILYYILLYICAFKFII